MLIMDINHKELCSPVRYLLPFKVTSPPNLKLVQIQRWRRWTTALAQAVSCSVYATQRGRYGIINATHTCLTIGSMQLFISFYIRARCHILCKCIVIGTWFVQKSLFQLGKMLDSVPACHYDSLVSPSGFVGAIDSAVPCSVILDVARTLAPDLRYLTLFKRKIAPQRCLLST